MASVTLRPTADSSLGHSCLSGSSGYLMIDDTSADGDSTYIYQSISSTSSASASSKFKISGTSVGKVKISSIALTINAKTSKGNSSDTASMSYSLSCNGKSGASGSASLTTSYADYSKTYSASDFGIADTVFDSFDAANLIVQIDTSGKKNASKNDSFQNRITQVYLAVTYEIVNEGTGIYLKQNGAYKQAQNAYKKVSGVWVKQDATALKTEMQSGKYILG